MANKLLQLRIPEETLVQIEAIFSALGLKTNEAIRIFLQQCINENGLPFDLKLKTPNEETLASMKETEIENTTKISLSDLKKEMGL